MSTFIGEFSCRADAKGRIVLPAAFKKVLEAANDDRFVVKKDIYEPCLILYPYFEWEKTMELFRSRINPYDQQQARFFRSFMRESAEMVLDGNARFLVPRRLMESVGADKDVVLLGMDQRIELWDAGNYGKREMDEQEIGLMATNLFGPLNGVK